MNIGFQRSKKITMKNIKDSQTTNEKTNKIVYIDTSRLHPHPDNPRKDLGDLTELADSIKSQGILQNLTVVPWFSSLTGVGCDDPKQQEEMGYTIVIGHRRHAAANLAGLTELPCVISDMPLREQVATMLLENIQRSDLTPYEQAQGFQMMMNLGDSVGDIVEQTGFSETTVRRRVKLLELDGDKFKEASERGGTLLDFGEIVEKIKGEELRNKVMAAIGTANFKNEFERAIQTEKQEENKAAWIEAISEFATRVDDATGYKYAGYYYTYSKVNVERPEDADNTEYFYFEESYGGIRLLKKDDGQAQQQTTDTEAMKRKERLEIRKNSLKDATARAFTCRFDFVRSVTAKTIKAHLADIVAAMVYEYVNCYPNIDDDELLDLIGIETPVDDEGTEEFDMATEVNLAVSKMPEKALLMMAYLTIGDRENKGYFQYWNAEHNENEDLDRLYALLEKLGYEMSDEERALQDGTHELFTDDEQKATS